MNCGQCGRALVVEAECPNKCGQLFYAGEHLTVEVKAGSPRIYILWGDARTELLTLQGTQQGDDLSRALKEAAEYAREMMRFNRKPADDTQQCDMACDEEAAPPLRVHECCVHHGECKRPDGCCRHNQMAEDLIVRTVCAGNTFVALIDMCKRIRVEYINKPGAVDTSKLVGIEAEELGLLLSQAAAVVKGRF